MWSCKKYNCRIIGLGNCSAWATKFFMELSNIYQEHPMIDCKSKILIVHPTLFSGSDDYSSIIFFLNLNLNGRHKSHHPSLLANYQIYFLSKNQQKLYFMIITYGNIASSLSVIIFKPIEFFLKEILLFF